jgi:hypothetical protein
VVPGVAGTVRTHIVGVDDPVNGTDPSDPSDYYQVSAVVTWKQGGIIDSVVVSTLVYGP